MNIKDWPTYQTFTIHAGECWQPLVKLWVIASNCWFFTATVNRHFIGFLGQGICPLTFLCLHKTLDIIYTKQDIKPAHVLLTLCSAKFSYWCSIKMFCWVLYLPQSRQSCIHSISKSYPTQNWCIFLSTSALETIL